jgi:hypothetical protein
VCVCVYVCVCVCVCVCMYVCVCVYGVDGALVSGVTASGGTKWVCMKSVNLSCCFSHVLLCFDKLRCGVQCGVQVSGCASQSEARVCVCVRARALRRWLTVKRTTSPVGHNVCPVMELAAYVCHGTTGSYNRRLIASRSTCGAVSVGVKADEGTVTGAARGATMAKLVRVLVMSLSLPPVTHSRRRTPAPPPPPGRVYSTRMGTDAPFDAGGYLLHGAREHDQGDAPRSLSVASAW